MYDHDGDGVYEATIEIPAPPTYAEEYDPVNDLRSAIRRVGPELESWPPPDILKKTGGWEVLNSTAYYRYKVATREWGQQDLFGLGAAPLPDDVSCVLGPVWDGAPTAPHTRATAAV